MNSFLNFESDSLAKQNLVIKKQNLQKQLATIYKKANLGKPNFALAPQAPVDPAEQQCQNEYDALLQYWVNQLQPPPNENLDIKDCIKNLTTIYAQTQSYCQTIAIVKEQVRCYVDLGFNSQPIWWYHPDHLGSSSYLTDYSGIPSHYYDYLPFGEEMVSQNTSVYNNFYKFSGKELDEDTGLYYFGARYYDPKWSVWLSVDAMAESNPSFTPYHYCSNNPVNRTDPNGMIDGEFERDENGKWQKTSTVGDEIGIDFYHTDKRDENGNQITAVTDRKGNWNVIRNGREALSGEQRGNDVNWNTIYNEWSDGTGPERSVFEGSHQSIKDLQFNCRLGDKYRNFVDSGESKAAKEINFNALDIWLSSNNMQAQMMGEFNISFYSLGDKVLNLVQDSKSRSSFYYHIPGIVNRFRDQKWKWNLKGYQEIDNKESNTYQTYIYLKDKKPKNH